MELKRKKHIPLLHEKITGAILDAYAQVYALYRERQGYSEENFRGAMVIELRERGFEVETEVEVQRTYRGQVIGSSRVDLVVAHQVAVELKKCKQLRDSDASQLMTYLRDLQMAVGLVLKFGGTKPEFRRVFEPRFAPRQSP